MPEGDTIHRVAAMLDRVLTGRPLQRVELPRLVARGPAPGTEIVAVGARGKHLLITFGDGTVLHTHLQMHGTWRVTPRGQVRRGSGRGLVAALATADDVATCHDAPVVELLDTDRIASHPVLRTLGPDLAMPGVDLAEVARRRSAARGDVPLVSHLLDQRIAAGIGNVFASELAYFGRTHPFTHVSAIGGNLLDRLYEQAATWLQDNVGRRHRTTVPDAPDGALWVYDRHGRPCRVCGTAIRTARRGHDARPAWWCPTCQPSPAATTGPDGDRHASA